MWSSGLFSSTQSRLNISSVLSGCCARRKKQRDPGGVETPVRKTATKVVFIHFPVATKWANHRFGRPCSAFTFIDNAPHKKSTTLTEFRCYFCVKSGFLQNAKALSGFANSCSTAATPCFQLSPKLAISSWMFPNLVSILHQSRACLSASGTVYLLCSDILQCIMFCCWQRLMFLMFLPSGNFVLRLLSLSAMSVCLCAEMNTQSIG